MASLAVVRTDTNIPRSGSLGLSDSPSLPGSRVPALGRPTSAAVAPAATYESSSYVHFDPVAYHFACDEVHRQQCAVERLRPKVAKLEDERDKHGIRSWSQATWVAGSAVVVGLALVLPVPFVGQAMLGVAAVVGLFYLARYGLERLQARGTGKQLEAQQGRLQQAENELARAEDKRRALAPPPFWALAARDVPTMIAPPASYGPASTALRPSASQLRHAMSAPFIVPDLWSPADTPQA